MPWAGSAGPSRSRRSGVSPFAEDVHGCLLRGGRAAVDADVAAPGLVVDVVVGALVGADEATGAAVSDLLVSQPVVLGRDRVRVVSADDLKVIYTSDTFPTTGYGVVYNLKPELQQQIQDAFFSFDWEGTGLAEEFGPQGEEQFVPITFQALFAPSSLALNLLGLLGCSCSFAFRSCGSGRRP